MKRIILIALLAALTSATLVAQVDIPLRNWTVPPYGQSAVSNDGIRPMSDITFNISFVAITVCRLLDTRVGTVWPLDGDGKYGADETRTYTIPPACGIPTGTGAVSLNITVTDTDSNPFGHLKIWPASQAEPNVSTLNWSTGGVTESNAAIVGLSGAGQLRVKTGNAGAHVIIDTNGYFNGTNLNSFFDAEGTGSSIGIIFGRNLSTTATSSGVRGQETGASGAVYGVLGEVTTSTTTGAAGVKGEAEAATGATYGVFGETSSNSNQAAGVLGRTGGDPINFGAGAVRAGVRGEAGSGIGVWGTSNANAILGTLKDGAGGTLAEGRLGTVSGTDPSGGAPPWAVFAQGNLGASGTKHFLDPHPSDPTKVISYISLEGPEAGTYFRGKARFQNGLARIDVPEHFAMVTDPEGLTVQITPIGEMASFAVIKMGLDEIVVKASRNVEFSYLVQGVRSTFRDVQPIQSDGVFLPESADARMPAWLSEGQKRVLIRNGTYRADGTVNMETAHRLGWDRIWADRENPTPRPTEP